MSQWQQIELCLRARSRGFHLITDEIVSQLPQLADFNIGLARYLYSAHLRGPVPQ